MNEKPIEMKVIAVRQLIKRTGHWTCTVTLKSPGGLHKDPTVDVDSTELNKVPECGDVLLVYPPKIVGYATKAVGYAIEQKQNFPACVAETSDLIEALEDIAVILNISPDSPPSQIVKKVKDRYSDEIHTCHEKCSREMCVMGRNLRRMQKALEYIANDELSVARRLSSVANEALSEIEP